MTDKNGRMQSPRIGLSNEATLVFADHSEVSITIVDVSERGFRLRSNELLEVGEEVVLRDHRGEARAQVRWVKGFEAGCLFLSGPADLE